MKKYKQLTYSQQLKCRRAGWWALLIGHIAYIIILSEMGGGDSRIQTNSAHAASVLIAFGGAAWMAYRIRAIHKLLKNPELRRQNMLNERDERNQYLHRQSGGAVWDLQFVALLAVTFYASMFNMQAFAMTQWLLVIAVGLKAGFYWWYSRG